MRARAWTLMSMAAIFMTAIAILPPVHADDVAESMGEAIKTLTDARNAYLAEQTFGDISGSGSLAAMEMVERAIALYEQEKAGYITVGDQETRLQYILNAPERTNQVAFSAINSMESEEAVYPFVLDAQNLNVVAEGAFPMVVGLPATFLNDADRPLEDIMEELMESDGAWVSYVYSDPQTDSYETKRSYLSFHDGYVFGAGYYVPTEAALVESVLAMIDSYGSIGTDAFAGAGPAEGPVDFTIVLNAETLEVVAPSGMTDIQDALKAGWPADMILGALEGGDGAYFGHQSPDPTAGSGYARAYLQMHDGYVFAAGHEITAEEKIRSLVSETILMYDTYGAEKTFAAIAGQWDPAQPYPGVAQLLSRALAAGGVLEITALTKADGSRLNPTGEPFIFQVDTAVAGIRDGIFADGFTIDPQSGKDVRRTSYSVVHDRHLFSATYQYVPQDAVISEVQNAVELYKEYGKEAFDRISWQAVQPRVIYPFVVDAETWQTLAHATVPGRVGVCCSQAIAEYNDLDQVRQTLETQEGVWVEYEFLNPNTQRDEFKNTYLVTFDGYTFGSGYYYTETANSQRLVAEMIGLYESDKAAAFDTINEMLDSASYAFVIDRASLNIVAHGADPNLAGTSLADYWSGFSARSIDDVVAELDDDGTAFNIYGVQYQEGPSQAKVVWLQVHDGHIFAASEPRTAYTR